MAIRLNSNFDYRGSNPNFERDVVETFEELKNLSGYPDGHLVYCKETKLHYKYNEELESGETGKFEEFKTGGVAVVESVDALDPNAEQGSLASVIVDAKYIKEEVNIVPSIADTLYTNESPTTFNKIDIKKYEFDAEDVGGMYLTAFGQFKDVSVPNAPAISLMGYDGKLQVYYSPIGDFTSDTTQTDWVLISNDGSISKDDVDKSLEEINGIISSWDTPVCTGYKDLAISDNEPAISAGREFFDKYFTFSTISKIENTEKKSELFIKNAENWTSINDVKIVDSIDKLDSNATQGSLASVAVNTLVEVKFSELYQPTSDEVNLETWAVDTTNLSRVGRISINSSYDTSVEIQEFAVYLISKDIDMQGGVGQAIGLAPGVAMTMNLSTQEQNLFELFTPNEDGTITVNEENLTIINNLLSSTEFVYGGATSMDTGESLDPSYADIFYKSSSGEQKTDLYIKDVKGWRTVSDEELKARVDNLQTIVDNLEDKTGLIVNSVDELPEESPIGSLGNVVSKKTKLVSIFDYPISQIEIINSKNFSWPPSQGPYFVIVGENYSGYYSIYFDTSDKILWRGNYQNLRVAEIATFDVDNESNTLQITSINQEELDFINEKAKGSTISRFSESYPERIELIKAFFNQFLAQSQDFDYTTLYVKNETGWEQYSELVDQSVTTEKLADQAITVEKISDSSVTLEKLSTDIQDKFTAIESQLTSKSTSIDFGANEDTTTLAIMDPSVITKIKTMNVSNLYISYGDVVKQEIDLSLSEQNIDLGDADFIVINITRTTDEIDAALGLTFINKTV